MPSGSWDEFTGHASLFSPTIYARRAYVRAGVGFAVAFAVVITMGAPISNVSSFEAVDLSTPIAFITSWRPCAPRFVDVLDRVSLPQAVLSSDGSVAALFAPKRSPDSTRTTARNAGKYGMPRRVAKV
jgi:hypothetical protein